MDMNQFTEEFGEIIGISVVNIKPSIAFRPDLSYYECCDRVVIVATREYILYRPIIGMHCCEGDLIVGEKYNIKESIDFDNLKKIIRRMETTESTTEEDLEKEFKLAKERLEDFGVKVTE